MRPVTPTPATALHTLVAVLALGGVAIGLVLEVVGGPESGLPGRIARGLSYFTIQSNLLVGFMSLLLARRPDRDGVVFRVIRLDSVVCVTVAGILYHLGIGSIRHASAASALTDLLLHTVTPIATVLVWFLVGPRRRLAWQTVAWSLVPPLLYAGYVAVNGRLHAWYPYPFLDPTGHGYGAVLGNVGLAGLLFAGLGAGVRQVEGLLRASPMSALDRQQPETPKARPGLSPQRTGPTRSPGYGARAARSPERRPFQWGADVGRRAEADAGR